MLRLPRWLAYRDKVLEHLDTLLVMYPRGRQFTTDFPGLPALIRSHFDDGAPAAGASVSLAAQMLRDLLGSLGPDERRKVGLQLQALQLDEIQPLVARHISGVRDGPVPPAELAVRLVGGALLMARRMVEEGSLDQREQAFLLERLDEALGPLPAEDRAAKSLVELFALPEKRSLWQGGA